MTNVTNKKRVNMNSLFIHAGIILTGISFKYFDFYYTVMTISLDRKLYDDIIKTKIIEIGK